jgi:hypothetical protein
VGCVAVVIALVFFVGAGVAVVAFYLGIDVLARWMISLIEPLMGPPFFAVSGAALILFAGWVLFRLATGHAPPGTPRRDLIISVMVLIGFAVLGVVVLLAAFAPPATDAPGF